MQMNNRIKIKVFDFLMTLKMWEFIYHLLYMRIFDKPSASMENKIREWIYAKK